MLNINPTLGEHGSLVTAIRQSHKYKQICNGAHLFVSWHSFQNIRTHHKKLKLHIISNIWLPTCSRPFIDLNRVFLGKFILAHLSQLNSKYTSRQKNYQVIINAVHAWFIGLPNLVMLNINSLWNWTWQRLWPLCHPFYLEKHKYPKQNHNGKIRQYNL